MVEKIPLKPRHKQLTKYTDEEKFGLFAEGKHRVPSAHRNKKKYRRKEKYKQW